MNTQQQGERFKVRRQGKILAGGMDQVFAQIAESTTSFQLGDEEVCTTMFCLLLSSATKNLINLVVYRHGARHTSRFTSLHHRMLA
jgi:hypothetical protein